MTFSEWITAARDLSGDQAADTAAQLLLLADSEKKLSARDISVAPSEKDGYIELALSGSGESYEDGFQPPPYDDDIRAGNVYVCSLLLYKMLHKELPRDLDALVGRCAVAASGGGSVPVLASADQRFGKLIEAASQISADKRITAHAALDMLAADHAGAAAVNIVEEETGARVGRFSVILDSACTRWKPVEKYIYDDQSFFPADNFELNIPYRVCEKEYTCPVKTAGYAEAANISAAPIKGTATVGIDFGAVRSAVSVLDSSGRLFEALCEGKISVPTPVFTSENETAGEFLRSLMTSAQEAAGGGNAVTACFVLPEDAPLRALAEELSGSLGWNACFISGAGAAGLYLRETDPSLLEENMIIFDAGKNAVSIALIKKGEKLPAQLASAPGGDEASLLTAERLSKELMSLGTDPDRNKSTVLAAAEDIKKRLSFDESASVELTFPTETGERKERITLERKELEKIMSPLLEKLEKAAEGALRAENMVEGDIGLVMITGGMSLMPAFRSFVTAMYPNARICNPYSTVCASRGAAVYACMKRGSRTGKAAGVLTADYGTQEMNAADGRPVFIRLLKAGEEFSVDGTLRIIYRITAGKNDLDDNKLVFRLYTRPKGMEHVKSTLSPENAIKYAGKAEAVLPARFDKNKDAVDFIVTVHSNGAVTAAAEHLRKAGAFSKIKNRTVRDGMEIIGKLEADFTGA